MTYSKKTLAIIGRQVVEKHPDIADCILQNIQSPTCTDLSQIPAYFKLYCLAIGVAPESITGPVYKSSITEVKKVFISAMITLYSDQHLFKKKLSETLGQHPPATSRMINEVEFRYKKDPQFISQVNTILKKIYNNSTDQKLN